MLKTYNILSIINSISHKLCLKNTTELMQLINPKLTVIIILQKSNHMYQPLPSSTCLYYMFSLGECKLIIGLTIHNKPLKLDEKSSVMVQSVVARIWTVQECMSLLLNIRAHSSSWWKEGKCATVGWRAGIRIIFTLDNVQDLKKINNQCSIILG